MFAMSMSQIDGIVQLELASPFDLFGVFTIEWEHMCINTGSTKWFLNKKDIT